MPFKPGDCTERFFQTVKTALETEASDLKKLSKKVVMEKSLHIDDAQEIMRFEGIQTSLNSSMDNELREKTESLTPFGLARRAENIRSSLSNKEWDKVVKLWANYLNLSAKTWEHLDSEELCSLMEGSSGLIKNLIYPIMALIPFGDGGAAHRESETGEVFWSGIVGTVMYIGDVVTFIPNVTLKNADRLKRKVYLRQAASAFRKFGKTVLKYGANYTK